MDTAPTGSDPDDEMDTAPDEELDTTPLEEIKGWAEAIVGGIGDTLGDMLRAGRQASRDATDDYWDRFDQKTRYRRDSK